MMQPVALTEGVEFDLLCLLVRPVPDLAGARRMLQAGADLSALWALAAHHRVRPRLVGLLGALDSALPEALAGMIADFQRHHCARALSLVHELRRLAAGLAQRGVPFAAFKGPVLAVALYGDPASREYADLDLIVPYIRYDEAEQALAALGYRGVQGDRAFRRAFLSHLRQFAFVRDEIDATIDLHWAFCGAHLPFPLSPDDIWASLEQVSVGGHALPTIGGSDLALLLAGHGTKEGWRNLDWVGDFAALVVARPALDWEDVYRRARQQRCGDSVLLACTMAERLLDVAVPRALTAPRDRRLRVARAADSLVQGLRQGRPAALPSESFTDLHLCERRRDTLRAVVTLALARTAGDYSALPLPPSLWRLYHATRPFRLAAKAIASLRQPVDAD